MLSDREGAVPMGEIPKALRGRAMLGLTSGGYVTSPGTHYY